MQTPKEYTKNLQNGIISTEMLNDCLYSVNKRAKNYRDAKRECRYDKYRDSKEAAEQAFYRKKEKLLALVQPVCIHKEFVGYERTRVYDYEQDFSKRYVKALLLNRVVHTNSYLDYDTYQEVFFFDEVDPEDKRYLYFLYYEIGTKSYHTPIEEANLKKYNLPIQTIGRLNTEGDNFRDLVSVQFVDKVLALIASGNYTYKETEPVIRQEYDNEMPEEISEDKDIDKFAEHEIKNCLENSIVIEMSRRIAAMDHINMPVSTLDFSLSQKYRPNAKLYKAPSIRLRNRNYKVNFSFSDDLLIEFRKIVKKDDYSLSELAVVVCNHLSDEEYRLALVYAYRSSILGVLQSIASKMYKKNCSDPIKLEDVLQEAEKQGKIKIDS